MSEFTSEKFPTGSLKPKSETGVLNFLKKYPNFDGSDVTIAIFDSGVDSRASGIQKLPNGDVKVIDRFDCSGAGDVSMEKIVTATEDSSIVGLSGRTLKLSKFMKINNISNEYRIGLKNLSDLYPSRVRDKIVADAKLKKWDEHNKKALADNSRELSDFENKNSNPATLTFKDKLAKENLDAMTEFLNAYDKKYSETKTTFDCILFQTNDGWVAVIDTTEVGDLEKAIFVKEYTTSYNVVNLDDYLSISINVHDDGNVLEIVGMCSSHGTHVASIASGYHSDNEDLNGVAPAAKIVSLTIGDGRLGSMETGTALVRAIIKVMELCDAGRKIDVINMSYGEHAAWSNSGRVGELMSELVNKYGVVWIASAGNHGPALSTIGTPPDIAQDSCIGVGAYVSPEMMEAEYALRNKLPGNVYTWTSRDPCIDGGSGVTVCAPGAAIASVPEFTMSKAQLMNGTSMSAPHVAGAVALIISGLKKMNINYTPFSIKRAMWNTATFLSYVDPFAQGNGLLNVEKLFEHLTTFRNEPENKLRFAITVGGNGAKGIHLRHGLLTKPEEYSVTVEPFMFNEKYANPSDKIDFNVRLTLIPSESWIECGKFIDLCYASRSFIVKVDPTGLPPGVFKGRIRAYDTSAGIEKGTVFEVPITVVQPATINNTRFEHIPSPAVTHCKPNTIIRDFILVPSNATYAVLEMISTDANDKVGGKFLVHTMQIINQKYCKAMETAKILPVTSDITTLHPFKCQGDSILEVCIAKYWSNFGEVPLQYKIKFHGFKSNNAHIMHSASGIHRIDLESLLTEECQPAISLKYSVMVLKPTESKITPLTKRDLIPNQRQIFQNVLSFNLHLAKAQELSLHAPLFSNVLYESEFESQFWMLFDSNKMLTGSGDAYSGTNFMKLDKGDYVVKLQVRHEKKDLLEKISEAVMLATFKLSSAMSLDIYKSFNNAVSQNKKITALPMASGISRAIYVAPLQLEKIVKNIPSGQMSWLEGTIIYAKDDVAKKVDMYNFQYLLIDGTGMKKPSNGSKDTTKSKQDEYKEGLRDYQCNQIAKLDAADAEEVYREVSAAYPTNYVQVHLAMVQHLEASLLNSDVKTQLPNTFKMQLKASAGNLEELRGKLTRIVKLCGMVVEGINQEALLAYYGMKSDNRPDATKIKTAMEKQKQQILEAFVKKAVALGKLNIIQKMSQETAEGVSVGSAEEIDDLLTEAMKYADLTDAKFLLLPIWQSYNRQHHGRMLKYLQKLYEDKLQREVLEEMQSIVEEKKWNHINVLLKRITVTANPQTFRMF